MGDRRQTHFDNASTYARELKKSLTGFKKIVDKEVKEKRELLQPNNCSWMSPKEIQSEKKRLMELENMFPDQLYRQLCRWIKKSQLQIQP